MDTAPTFQSGVSLSPAGASRRTLLFTPENTLPTVSSRYGSNVMNNSGYKFLRMGTNSMASPPPTS
jgi:hypothetical protein